MKSVLSFDAMLTPKLVTGLYYLLLLIALVSGVGVMFNAYTGVTATSAFTGVLTIFFGAIGARIWCELMIVIFKINENLQFIRESKQFLGTDSE